MQTLMQFFLWIEFGNALLSIYDSPHYHIFLKILYYPVIKKSAKKNKNFSVIYVLILLAADLQLQSSQVKEHLGRHNLVLQN